MNATKILAHDRTIELENFTTAPVMLTEVRAEPRREVVASCQSVSTTPRSEWFTFTPVGS